MPQSRQPILAGAVILSLNRFVMTTASIAIHAWSTKALAIEAAPRLCPKKRMPITSETNQEMT